MFTGIVEELGTITNIENGPDSAKLTINAKGFFAGTVESEKS